MHMDAQAFLSCVRNGAAVTLVAAIGFSSPAYANFQSFLTPAGSTAGGKPVSAQADFTTTLGNIEITLTNLQANPVSIIQAISDLFFKADGLTTVGAGSFNAAGDYINISRTKVVTPGGSDLFNWQLTNTGGTYHLNKLCGPCGGPAGLVIGPGPYTDANGSIAGNRPHNPFADQTVTFNLALAGVTADTVISNVVFSFGTETGTNVAVPIPAAVWLFGSGLLGLIAIVRRRQAGIATASPVTA
jgi:hypothetical protein